MGLLELLREPTPLKNYCSRLFSGSWTGKTSIHWVAASSQSNRQPATCGQEARPVSRKRVDPAALPLGSQRSRTQIAFSRWRRLALAEIHGVESPKPGAEIGFSEFCTTPIRNARFLHKWPSGLQGGGVSRHPGPVLWGLPGGAKNHKKRETVAIFSVSAPIRATPIAFSRLPAPRLPKMASSSPR